MALAIERPYGLRYNPRTMVVAKTSFLNVPRSIAGVFVMMACGIGLVATAREFTEDEKAWWAVQPVKEVKVPKEAVHPVDFFIDRKLSKAALEVAPKASAEEFLRRAFFDLHGLPPSIEEVEQFTSAWEADQEKAITDLIERLLESPRYGERWGQHWLDVVRYADSDGYRADDFRPTAFRYRDYVIKAFNEDKSYREFVLDQLAADELTPNDPDRVAATGFLRHGVYEWNQRNAEMQREIMINEVTNVTGEVFLGVGVGCAQCHDHKFDPILQKDYFAMQAFLSSVYWPDDHHHAQPAEIEKFKEAKEKWEAATAGIRAEMKSLVQKGEKAKYDFRVETFPPEVQEIFAKPKAEQTSYERQISFLVERQAIREVRTRAMPSQVLKKDSPERARYEELEKKLAAFADLKPKLLPKAFLTTDTGNSPAEVKMKSEIIEPQFFELLGGELPNINARKNTTGRRSALAEWIVREDNPFTARVMVNRIWQYHFGKGLASSPNDFGMLGEEPTHPELFDWLANDFMSGGWTMKRMHKLIMTSEAYRRTARFEPSNSHSVSDPENSLLWRFPPRRLSAEQIRDAMLAISGELTHRDGGSAQGGSAPVRSVYVKKMRNTPERILQCFDSPLGFASQPDRLNTTTPTQSLLLANSEWPLARGRAMAKRILGGKEAASAEEVARAYAIAWGRKASEGEVKAALDFLKLQKTNLAEKAGEKVFPKGGFIPLAENFEGAKQVLNSETQFAFSLNQERSLRVSDLNLSDDHFTVSAVARLDQIHASASVNTLISQWNGSHQGAGWSVGVTSAKSRYGERNFIVQLVGRNPGGDLEYEVVASDLRVPLGTPVQLAVAIKPQAEGKGTVRFFLKDLSKPENKWQIREIEHNIAGGIFSPRQGIRIGGRKDGSHFWEGSVARLAVIAEAVAQESELDSKPALFDFKVTRSGGLPPQLVWKEKPQKNSLSPECEAFADFCHALMSSNEFLYLH